MNCKWAFLRFMGMAGWFGVWGLGFEMEGDYSIRFDSIRWIGIGIGMVCLLHGWINSSRLCCVVCGVWYWLFVHIRCVLSVCVFEDR